MPSETDVATDKTGTEPADDPAVQSDDEQLSAQTEANSTTEGSEPAKNKRRINWAQALVYVVLPGLAVLLALTAGFLKYQDASARDSRLAGIEAVAAAKDATAALLSYQPDSAAKDLDAARGRLTGTFKESYSQLIHDVVVPGAKDKRISSVATVPAAASVSATGNHAVVVLFVNQTTIVGNDAPTESQSSVRVTLEKIDGRWLVSGFEPI